MLMRLSTILCGVLLAAQTTFWVDLHISKVLYKPEEHELFELLVKAIRFEPKEKKAS